MDWFFGRKYGFFNQYWKENAKLLSFHDKAGEENRSLKERIVHHNEQKCAEFP